MLHIFGAGKQNPKEKDHHDWGISQSQPT